MPSLSTRDTVTGVVAGALEPFILRGAHVELVPLAPDQAGELAAAASGDRSTYAFTDVPDDVVTMGAYIVKLLGQRERGEVVPFAQRRVDDGRLIGCTRFLDLRHWRGRPEPDEVEIGGTWLAADAQRTPVNTEAKLLLLTHAFEVWRVWRVALCTDARNERSWKAIERLGARHEGVLRNHRPSYVAGEAGRPRDSALFAITDTEWPEVRARLLHRLTGA
jgi:RimJ/RimL family protein N-acetyltransferase